MQIFKLLTVDMVAARKRVNIPRLFNARQRRNILKLYDLFEAGKWQDCLNLIRDKTKFRNNESEYIDMGVSDVMRELGYENFFTSEQLLKEAEEVLTERKKKAS